jgi:uncharacterized protein YfiM (DUF2279 family)
MPSDATLVIDAETGKAIRELAKLAVEQTRIEKGAEAIGRAHKRSELSLGDFIKKGAQLAGVTFSVTQLVSSVLELKKSYADAADEAERLAKARTPLTQTNPGEVPRDIAMLAARQAVEFGIAPDIGVSTFQSMQSLYGGSKAQGLAAAQEAYQLQRLGASSAGASAIISFGKERGLTPEQSANYAMIAGDVSKEDLNYMANVGPALLGWKDPALAWAIAGKTTGAYRSAEELTTGILRSGQALTSESKFLTGMQGKAKAAGKNWDAMSEIEQLQFVRSQMGSDVSAAALERAGLSEELQRTGLSAALRNLPGIEQTRQRMLTAPLGMNDREIARQMETDAMWRAAFTSDQQKQQTAFTRQFGPAAYTGEINHLKWLNRAAQMRQDGHTSSFYINPETGEPTWPGLMFIRPRQKGVGQPYYNEFQPEIDRLKAERETAVKQEQTGYKDLLAEMRKQTEIGQKTLDALNKVPVQTPSTKGPAALQE